MQILELIIIVIQLTQLLQGNHFSGISVNLEMSENSTKVSENQEKSPKVNERSVKGRVICVIREI